MPFMTYPQTRPFASVIQQTTRSRRMPTWFPDPRHGRFANDPSLSPQEFMTFPEWAEAEAPGGDPHDAPLPRPWAERWPIPRPDLQVCMPKRVDLAARGEVEYTYEIVPTGFAQGRWIEISEVRLTSRTNVHHAMVYLRPPDSK
jgi:hypothetical protein